MNKYYLGGSPCSGKSTVAQALAGRFSLAYFRVDDRLDEYLSRGASEHLTVCAHLAAMTPDEIWLRNPVEQCRTELAFYVETFDYLANELAMLPSDTIIEGAACMPHLMQRLNISPERFIAIVPTPEFQLTHYRKRPWVKNVLAGCSNKQLAFERWMKRDMLFADAMLQQCRETGYRSVVNDGSMSIDAMTTLAAAHFNLNG